MMWWHAWMMMILIMMMNIIIIIIIIIIIMIMIMIIIVVINIIIVIIGIMLLLSLLLLLYAYLLSLLLVLLLLFLLSLSLLILLLSLLSLSLVLVLSSLLLSSLSYIIRIWLRFDEIFTSCVLTVIRCYKPPEKLATNNCVWCSKPWLQHKRHYCVAIWLCVTELVLIILFVELYIQKWNLSFSSNATCCLVCIHFDFRAKHFDTST